MITTPPTPAGVISANQFNQNTNASIIGRITAGSSTATNPYVPITAINPNDTNAAAFGRSINAPSVAGVISANQFNQTTNANIVGTILKSSPTTGVRTAVPQQLSTYKPLEIPKNIFSNPTFPVVGKSNAFNIGENDWRVRLSLAKNADYLYGAASDNSHILYPLKLTNGVIFPYNPTINVSYSASYDPVDVVHTNYKLFQYRNSSVGDISISAEFTAQDTNEALYLLAVIHFFKSVTKMFYGNDTSPRKGSPPPLCFLTGYGTYQFVNHPLVITNFNYSLPADVDYIRATLPQNTGGQNLGSYSAVAKSSGTGSLGISGIFNQVISKVFRLQNAGVPVGAQPDRPMFQTKDSREATYVPTKMTIQLGASPVVSRNDISNNFSVAQYSKGDLIRKGFW